MLCIGKDLSGFIGLRERLAHIAWNHRCIIEQIQNSSSMLGQNNLLFSSLDRCGEMYIVCFFNFLTGLSIC